MSITPFYQMAIRVIRKFQSWFGISTLGARAIIINQNNQGAGGQALLCDTKSH